MRSTVEVTEFHIANGEILGFSTCPIALALRSFYETDDVAVGVNGFRIKKLLFDFGDHIKRFMLAFDLGKKG